jgi:hypothetical protein
MPFTQPAVPMTLEHLYRSSRGESALTLLWIRRSGVTSAATRFMEWVDVILASMMLLHPKSLISRHITR